MQCASLEDLDPFAAAGRRLDRAVLGIVAAEEAGVDDDAADDAGNAKANRGVIVSGSALAAALPAVHPLAAVGVLRLAPDRLGLFDEVLFFGEEVVGGVEHRAAEALRGEVGKLAEVHRTHCPIGAPSAFTPRTYVAFTTPCSSWPAYGVILCRCSIMSGSTRNVSSGAKTTKSASYPAAR